MVIKQFTFNDFSENTYIIHDDTLECIIIDPGCNNAREKSELTSYILDNKLKPVQLINTHCHIDHILGNKFICDTYNLKLTAHKGEIPVLQFGTQTALMYQIQYETSPSIEIFIDENDKIRFGNTVLDILFTPGHSPASVSLYNKDAEVLIAGDVLFQGSIGRTDLPGGDHKTLLDVIKTKFFILPDETIVYSGHGPRTRVGIEKRTNPFF